MIVEVKIPEIDKDAEEYYVFQWMKENGSRIQKNDELVEIESDEYVYTITADEDGILEIVAQEGTFIKHHEVLYHIITNDN